MLTTEQREVKRQMDQARRGSKMAARVRRAGSGSSYTHSPPSSIADLTSPAVLPVYTTAPTQMSLLTEPATTMAPTSYMPSYTPPMADQSQPIFPSPYQQPYIPDCPLRQKHISPLSHCECNPSAARSRSVC